MKELRTLSARPTLHELLNDTIAEIARDDTDSKVYDVHLVIEENETFYFRVIYLFLSRANKYYSNKEVEKWLKENLLKEEYADDILPDVDEIELDDFEVEDNEEEY